MSRLPVAAFVTLVVATIGAFFVVQHLKVTTPLLTGSPAPFPSAINPVDGGVCLRRNHVGRLVGVNFKTMSVSFYLLNQADNVDVYILDAGGKMIRELPGSGLHMAIKKRHVFTWNGREANGSIAPDGPYYIRVSLIHQRREVKISNNAGPEPVTVMTQPPHPLITSVTPSTIAYGSGSTVTIRFSGNDSERPRILLYRLTPNAGSRLVKSFAATSLAGHSVWNGEIGGAPAPRGTYLVALQVTDRACTTGSFPSTLPPAVASDPHAEITVS